MHGVVLAAGRGSRLGGITKDRPKLMVQVRDKTIYEHQIEILELLLDSVTIVLGHGYENVEERELRKEFRTEDYKIPINFCVLHNWNEVENAATLALALRNIATERENILVLCGDVIFTKNLLTKFIDRYRSEEVPPNFNAVAYIEGAQDEMTSIKYDKKRNVVDYGAIEGHQEAGLFIINKTQINECLDILEAEESEWFPIVFPITKTKAINVDPTEHNEINTPKHLEEARKWMKRYTKTVK